MTAIPFESLRLDGRSHQSALWWLVLLYRRPKQFEETLAAAESWQQMVAGLRLYCHQLPYAVSICSLGRMVIFGALGFKAEVRLQSPAETLLWHAELIAVGLAYGIVFGIALGLVGRITCGIAGGIAIGVAFGVAFGLAGGLAYGLAFGIAIGVAGEIVGGFVFGIAIGIAVGIAYGIVVGIGVGVAYGLAVGIGIGVTSSMAVLRAYYQALQPLFLWPKVKGSWYPYHPVAWDDCCRIPFPGLDRLLVDYHEQEFEAAEREIARLIDSYPSQRFQALRARATLVARRAGRSRDLSRLDEIVAILPEGDKGFLAQTRWLREMLHEISGLQARLDTLDRPLLREPLARLLSREIERFRESVASFREPLAQEFRSAAGNWLTVAKRQLTEAAAVLGKEPTRQVFRAGVPVDREREAFVPRNAVSGEIERQVMLATGCPGIVLYGRRRTGKSTVLRNLDASLPPHVLRVRISMQNPAAFNSLADLVATLTGALDRAVEGLVPAIGANDLRYLFRSLDTADRKLSTADRSLLISIDEYENLDRKIGEGIFPRDLLATLRESIQTHRHITWIFAGSHEITELPHASWASYLVSARTIEVGPFTVAETRLLLTEPLKYSTLWLKDDPTRPRFEPGFWGEGGIERIHAEAGGWPHLVQLVAETVVDLLNVDRRTSADAEFIERALGQAILHGHAVLHELMREESTLPGEWAYLAGFRTRTTQPPPADEEIARSLRRRLLVTDSGSGLWRLRVPLMERWLRERG